MNAVSRRKFLKISAATIASATALGTVSCTRDKIKASAEKGIKTIPTYCNICFWKCGAIATLKDGELWKIEGNPVDPLSRGRLCPRGTGGIGAYSDPDRLKTPLIRKKGSKRGEEEFVSVTWDEALTYIADKMNDIKSKYGAQSMAAFSHGTGGKFLKHTLKAYGAKNIVAPSFAQCRGPREVGFELTNGNFIGSPERTDIKDTKCMALIGSHLGENMHNSQVQEFSEAIANDASIIVVDPRFSVAAGKAKYYLPIKPGTDLALLLSWMNVMISEGIYDKKFVEDFGFGFEQLAEEVKKYTPEWAYVETGIEPDLIRATARELAKNKPASFIHPGRHVTWYGDDTQRSRAIAILNSLLGNWNRKGGFYEPSKVSLPKYPTPAYPEMAYEKADNPGKKWPLLGDAEGSTTGLRDATITGKPYPIKGWLVYATNLIQSLPDERETIAAINNLDLLVVIDVIPNEIAGYADVVLPESIYLERHDEFNNAPFRQSFLSIRQPVIASPDDQKPNWWIAKKLAEKLGLGHYHPWKNLDDYLRYTSEKAGFSYERLKKEGVILGPKKPINVEEGATQDFWTKSGKVEFYSTHLEELGFDPIPKYTKPEQPPSGYFRLLFGRAPMHTFSMTQTNPLLSELMDENVVWVNNDVARQYGIENGQYIKLKNQDGIIGSKVKVYATERIRTDCVFMVHGFGHRSKALKSAYLKGGSDSLMVTKYKVDPIMSGTGMNVNFVTFETEA
ncbi:MAG: molybdopterin-dependent oxidoreductase [Candidatus Kapabacteria bacterium]|jgi:thiosulfate reductase/polysulfide reductase chain A|nr:molybdopterin-dependent oxidoreductase [Candidatus Kapabacteria bacterium]